MKLALIFFLPLALMIASVLVSQARHKKRARAMDDYDLDQAVFNAIQSGDFPNAYTVERNRRYLAEEEAAKSVPMIVKDLLDLLRNAPACGGNCHGGRRPCNCRGMK